MRDRIRANLKISAISLIIVAIISYAYFETSDVFRGPIIEIDEPTSGYSSSQSIVEIRGSVENVSYMFLNGRPIFADSSGRFKERVILSDGYNSIYIEAKDRIGQKSSQLIEMVYNTGKPNNNSEGLARDHSPVLNP